MFNWISQTIAVTALNLRTIPQRLGSSGVAIVGIAGVVVVLVSVLSIASGFTAAMRDSGSPTRAIVMRSGADSEMTSGLAGPEVDVIKQAAGIRHEGPTPLASAELYVVIDLPKKSTNTSANVPMRGVDRVAQQVRNEATIVDGRMFEFGTNEIIVGRGASRQFAGLTVGNQLRSGQNSWKVVGMFEADGGVAETELWCDVRVLQGAYRRGNTYQTVLVRLDSSDSFNTFRDALTSNPQVNVQVRRETEYYAQQSRTLSSLIRGVGFGIAGLMGVGAVFGAILTMYTAVSTRSREIATLRALGFNATSVVVSVLAESLVLAAIGGAIGGLAAYLAFNGYQTSTMNFQTFSQVAFAFQVTPQLLVLGLVYALLMGLVGGLFPAIRAARLPIPTALREL
jgi:putative ABC transport system permease protein